MVSQRGLLVDKAGGDFHVSDAIDKPSPSATQILVKTLAVAINPVDWKQAAYGFLVDSFPIVLGTDAAGEVVEVGSSVTTFKVGDIACGCTRLGVPGFSAYQDFHLYDASLAIKKPDMFGILDAAALGVGAETAGLGVFFDLQVPMLTPGKLPKEGEEWVLVTGGASVVGLFGIQYLKMAGYKVVTTNSTKTDSLVKSYGADATVDYHLSGSDQNTAIAKVTQGKLTKVLDTVGADGIKTGVQALNDSPATHKLATSIEPEALKAQPATFPTPAGITLGPIGRAPDTNAKIEKLIPMIEALVTAGLLRGPPLKPLPGLEGGDWEDVVAAIEINRKGVSGEKLVVLLGGRK